MAENLNNELELIQNSLQAELNTPDPDKNGKIWLNEKEVDRYKGLKISINSNEHTPIHFHVSAGDKNASFTIKDCLKLNGNTTNAEDKKIRKWFNQDNNKEKLIQIWNDTRPNNCPVGKYEEER